MSVTCPVALEFLGLPVGACGQPTTHEVTFVCEGGCASRPVKVCQKHADILAEDRGDAFCAECELTGNPQQIHPAQVREIGGAS